MLKMVSEKKIKNFCKVTRAKEIDVCQDGEGGMNFKIVNGKKRSKLCARVKCDNFK